MKFHIMGRHKIEKLIPIFAPHIVISIHSKDQESAKVAMNPFTKAILSVQFDDLDGPPGPSWIKVYGQPMLFTEGDAKTIKAFVEAHSKGTDWIICQCGAGISRSSATAAALARWYGQPDTKYFAPPYVPNRLVYRTLLDILMTAT